MTKYKIGDVVMVQLPEFQSTHSVGRSCVITNVNDKGEYFIVPFSTKQDYKHPELGLFPAGIGGRNQDGFIVPNMQGWCNPNRLYKLIGHFNDTYMEYVQDDLNVVPWKIIPWQYK